MRYNLFSRELLETDLAPVLAENGLGAITFSPLAQGLLTNRYLRGIPEDSRAHRKEIPFLSEEQIAPTLRKITQLQEVAEARGQTLAPDGIGVECATTISDKCLNGASRLSQLQESVKMKDNLVFAPEELATIETILAEN